MDNANLLTISDSWKAAYPDALVGILAIQNVINLEHHAALDQRKAELEANLRSRYAGLAKSEFARLPSFQPYTAYYRRFGKTYHVQLQLESVVLKGKSLPRVAALVEAMFMAELKNGLLTAGHDLDAVTGNLRLDVANGDEHYTLLNGQEQVTRQGDMMITDEQGIISSILYGPDSRTRIVPTTTNVLFTVYGPPGISQQAMAEHLEDIRSNVLLIAPRASVLEERVLGAT